MFYINSKKNGVYGIKDTEDGIEEFYSYPDVVHFLEQGIKIFGVSGYKYEPKLRVLTDAEVKLYQMERGTPFRIKLSSNLDWKQCILMGIDDNYFIIFDNSGVNGYFELSWKYVRDYNVKISLDNNPTEVASLLKILNTGASFNKDGLLALLKQWKELHNPSTDRLVGSYLDLAPIGTKVIISYYGYGDGTKQRFDSVSTITRLKDGNWLYEEELNTFDGKIGSSFDIGLFGLQVALYGHIKKLEVIYAK